MRAPRLFWFLMMKKLYLIDISALFFRSYYAISPSMASPGGLPTNALYGSLKMLHKLIREKRPDYIICCFDSKEPSFRKKIFPDYKANRGEMPEDLALQAPYLKKMMEAMRLCHVEAPGFEADDIVASLTKRWLGDSSLKGGLEIYIVSGDKDFAQLVSGNVFLYDTMRERIYDAKAVREKWGVRPDQMLDYLSLTGDSSDNIPGARGIGPKTAAALLNQHQSLEAVYKSAGSIKGAAQKKLEAGREGAFLSRKLIALREDIKWEGPPSKAALKSFESFSVKEKLVLKDFLDDLGFRSFLNVFFPRGAAGGASGSEQPGQSGRGRSDSSGSAFAGGAAKSKPGGQPRPAPRKGDSSQMGLFESKNLEPAGRETSFKEFFRLLEPCSPVWCFMAPGENSGGGQDAEEEACIFLAAPKKTSGLRAALALSLPEWREAGRRLDKKWARYAGYDLKSLWRRLGCQRPLLEWDSMLAGHLLDSRPQSSFESLCQLYLKNEAGPLKEKPEAKAAEEPPLRPQPEAIYQKHQELKKILEQKLRQMSLKHVFQNIELPLTAALYDMERRGMLLNGAEIKKQSEGLKKDTEALDRKIHALAGREFNLSSPKQLAEVLFDNLKIPKGRKTKSGYSTDSHELGKKKNLHPIIPLILERRELFKLKSGFTDSLLSQLEGQPEDSSLSNGKRIHSQFRQAAASTGRISSASPNLQNIPIRSQRGRQIRKAFAAPAGSLLISADYSQLELRILAHITEDPGLMRAFAEGLDVHAATAADIFHVPLSQVSPEMRRKSKAVNFGIAYGQGAHGLSEALGVSRGEAKEIIQSYFSKFKKIRDYIETAKEEAAGRLYVQTVFGRKRFFSRGDFAHPRTRAAAERAAINAPIQGTASDIVKLAMIQLSRSLPIPIVSQVHDELLFECPAGDVESESREIAAIMEGCAELKAPLKVNVAAGADWASAHSA